jgi:hypothetical protein
VEGESGGLSVSAVFRSSRIPPSRLRNAGQPCTLVRPTLTLRAMKKLPYIATFLLLLLAAARGALTKTHDQTVALSVDRSVVISVPEGFSFDAGRDDTGAVVVRLASAGDTVTLDLLFLPDPEGRFAGARARKELINEKFKTYVDSSTEKAMQFEELDPRTGAGTYCVFTDASLVGKDKLPPGEYLHFTAGVKAWPGVLAVFRWFHNDTTSPAYQAVLSMLKTSVDEKPVPLK